MMVLDVGCMAHDDDDCHGADDDDDDDDGDGDGDDHDDDDGDGGCADDQYTVSCMMSFRSASSLASLLQVAEAL